MKTKIFLSAATLVTIDGYAQGYSINWYKVAGGGGTSTNGALAVSGTIGQADAVGAMNSGNYSVTDGFWSLINVVQSAGLPNLRIVPNGANSVKLLWANTGTYTLLQTPNLASESWTTNTSSITTANGTNRSSLRRREIYSSILKLLDSSERYLHEGSIAFACSQLSFLRKGLVDKALS